MFRLKPIRHYQAYENNIENIFYNCVLSLISQHSQAKKYLPFNGATAPSGPGSPQLEVSLSN
jgi:hypothetical protein